MFNLKMFHHFVFEFWQDSRNPQVLSIFCLYIKKNKNPLTATYLSIILLYKSHMKKSYTILLIFSSFLKEKSGKYQKHEKSNENHFLPNFQYYIAKNCTRKPIFSLHVLIVHLFIYTIIS